MAAAGGLEQAGGAKAALGGKVDGKLYAVNLGSNSKAMVYDTSMLANDVLVRFKLALTGIPPM